MHVSVSSWQNLLELFEALSDLFPETQKYLVSLLGFFFLIASDSHMHQLAFLEYAVLLR